MRNSITYANGHLLGGEGAGSSPLSGLLPLFSPAAQAHLMKQPRHSNLNEDNVIDISSDNSNSDNTMICKRVVTRDGRYITQITCYEKGQDEGGNDGEQRQSLKLPLFGTNAGQQGGGALASLFGINNRQLDLGGRCTRKKQRQQKVTLVDFNF